MLWTIGLVGHLSHYNDFVFTDFHPVLNFGRNHSFEELTKSCKLVPQTDFEVKREAAMLVYWCCLEARNDVFKEKNLDVVIEEVFGRQHVEILRKMDMFDAQINNLLVNGKRIPELNDAELAKLIQIAEKRFYAFEWIASEDNWDSVDLVC